MSKRFVLVGFFVCSYALTWACWLPVVLDTCGYLSVSVPRQSLQMLGSFGPFVSALIWARIEGGKPALRKLLGSLLIFKVKPLWILTAIFLPALSWIVALGMFAMISGTSVGTFSEPAFDWMSLPIVFGIILVAGGSLGEEPGWRGFALPRLLTTGSRFRASLILGIAWAGWHLPLWLMGDRAPGYPFLIFILGAIPLTAR